MANRLARNRSLFPFGPFWDDVFGQATTRGTERAVPWHNDCSTPWRTQRRS